jgi:hypothetical protein
MPPHATDQSPFAGFTSPNYTQVPDELFDVLLPTLSDAELRCLLYIIRRTFGFKRDADSISLSQMVHGITTRDGQVLDSGTGLSKSTVARGLKALRDRGVIVATRNISAERGDEPTTYCLRFKTDSIPEKKPTKPVSRHQDTLHVSPVGQAVYQLRDTQETVEQHTDFEHSNWDEQREDGVGRNDIKPVRGASRPTQVGLALGESSLASIVHYRVRRDANGEDRVAISAAVERFSESLGDQADVKVSISRALNLFQASGVNREAYIDLLFQAEGEVKDRRRFPGKAPIPRKLMPYFFAVVEDRLGLKAGVK